MSAQKPTISQKPVRIQSEKYLVRPINVDDASDRWAGWMSDPEAMHMLNMPARIWKKADVVKYIRTFDQRSHLLLGIFDRQRGLHIGIFTVDINFALGEYLVNLLIGEPDYRNKGVTSSLMFRFREYFFETLGLKVSKASVLARNTAITHYLLKTGWRLEQTIKGATKSHATGESLDICLFSLSRDAWRDWKKKNLG